MNPPDNASRQRGNITIADLDALLANRDKVRNRKRFKEELLGLAIGLGALVLTLWGVYVWLYGA